MRGPGRALAASDHGIELCPPRPGALRGRGPIHHITMAHTAQLHRLHGAPAHRLSATGGAPSRTTTLRKQTDELDKLRYVTRPQQQQQLARCGRSSVCVVAQTLLVVAAAGWCVRPVSAGCHPSMTSDLKPHMRAGTCTPNMTRGDPVQTCNPSCDSGYTPAGQRKCEGCVSHPIDGCRKDTATCTCTHPCSATAPAGVTHGSACPADKCVSETCTVKCDDGYDSNGTAAYTCSSSGSWSGGSLTCTAKRCPATQNMGTHVKNCPEGHFDPDQPSTCKALCEPNYEPKEGSPTYTCDHTGTWSGGSLTCQGISCGKTPPGDHFPASAGEIRFPASSSLQLCDRGYTANGTNAGVYRRVFKCNGKSGFLPNDALQCKPITCGDISKQIKHEDSCSCSCSGEQLFGDSCEAQCLPGYTAKDDAVTITCTTVDASKREVKFDRSIDCEKVSCTSSTWMHDQPLHANFSAACSQADYRSPHTCTATCLYGFTGGDHGNVDDASEEYVCQADKRKTTGLWLPKNQAHTKDLQCLAVDCGRFEDYQKAHGPYHIKSGPEREPCSSAGHNPLSKLPQYFRDSCKVQCLNGW